MLTVTVRDLAGNLAVTTLAINVVAQPKSPIFYYISNGPNLATSVNEVAATYVRTYTRGQLDAAQAMGVGVHHSAKPNLSLLASGDSGTINSLISEGSAILDRRNQRFTVGHETNNDQPKSSTLAVMQAAAATYQKAWGVFLTQVMPAINFGRLNKIISVDIMTGDVGEYPGGTDLWAVPGSDEVAWDIYNPAKFPLANAYANSMNGGRGKPWSIPETGYVAGGTASSGTDAQKVVRLKSDNATYTKYPNLRAVALFNNNGSIIDGCPQSIAYWKSLIATNA